MERLSRGEEWKCDSCSKKVCAAKQLTIHEVGSRSHPHLYNGGNVEMMAHSGLPCTRWRPSQQAPLVLVVHLKRFSYGFYSTKIHAHVDFPMDLNLTRFVSDPNIKVSGAVPTSPWSLP